MGKGAPSSPHISQHIPAKQAGKSKHQSLQKPSPKDKPSGESSHLPSPRWLGSQWLWLGGP